VNPARKSPLMNIPLKVLLAEDSEDDAVLIGLELRRGGYEPICTRVETAKTFAAQLKQQEWDLVISDYIMPKFGGFEALEIVKKQKLDIPFIIVSGKIGEETAVQAMKAGAHDYIMKDNLARLIPAIQRELKESAVRKERRLAEGALQESEKRFALFMRHLPGLAYIKDEQGKILYINEYIEKAYGWKIKEVLGKTDFDLWPQEVAYKLREGDQQVILKRKVVESIDEIERDGEIITYLSYKFPIIRKGSAILLGVISVDITKRKQAEDLLKQTTEQLKIEREALERKNIALREILNQIEAEKNTIKQQIVTNVEQAIIPTLMRMKEASHPSQTRNFELLERELREIVSPFLDTLKNKYAKLSPRELEVCRLIKNGMTSKEIAEAMNLSLLTIHKYRELIRKKLGLANRDTNLQTYLQSI
jgi:two-component system sensor histidine kinase UhpB